MGDPLAYLEALGKSSADAVPERIAGSEHRCRTTATAQHAVRIERDGPRTAAIANACKHEMAFAAKDDFGLGKRLSACLGEPSKAIFADADDDQPGISHDARPHSGRNRRRQSARGQRLARRT